MFTVNEHVDLNTRPGLPAVSVLRSTYTRIGKGDIKAVPAPQGSKEHFLLPLESVCAFAVLNAFARMGAAPASPISETLKIVMSDFRWMDAPAQFATPLEWAITEIRAASAQMLIAVYFAHDAEAREDVLVGAIFPTDQPQIVHSEIARLSLSLNDLLGPIITRADAIEARKAGTRVQ